MSRSANALGARGALIGYSLSALGAMLFATKGVLIKLVYGHGIDTTTLLAARMALATPVFAAVGYLQWRRMGVDARPDGRTLGKAAAVGVLGYHLSSWLDFSGLRSLDVQAERLVLFTYPFFVLLFARLIYARPMRRHALAGAVLSYAGLAVMFASAPARMSPEALGGGALVLAAAGSFALYQLFGAELIGKLGPALFTAIAMSAAGVSVMLHFALTTFDLPAVGREAAGLIVMIALFATVLPAFIMSAGTARIGAQGTAIISTLSPIATSALAVAVLAEPFGLPEVLGSALVIGGVGFYTALEIRRSRATAGPNIDKPTAASAA